MTMPATRTQGARKYAPQNLTDGLAGLAGCPEEMTFVDRADEHVVTIGEVIGRASRLAGALRDAGVRPGDRLLIANGDHREFIEVFVACLWSGVTAVPLAVPHMTTNKAAYLANLRRFAEVSGSGTMVANRRVAEMVADEHDFPARLVQLDAATGPAVDPAGDDPGAVALLQFTSGSTALPKGVVVHRRNLLANVTAIGEALQISEGDRAVSWLPLHHDMGLIGMFLCQLLYAGPGCYQRPLHFLRSPLSWCETISRLGGTISFAPDFAYRIVARMATPEVVSGWDLSSWRVAGCGAEPIKPSTVREFAAAMAPAGFDPAAFLPAYGSAEATLAITFRRAGPRFVRADADVFRSEGRVAPPRDGAAELEFTSCGTPVPTVEVEIVGEGGESLPEGHEGQVFVRGPSVAGEYLNNPRATAETFTARGLATGDRGFVLDGELFISGREKDMIILNGRNVHAHDVEWCVASELDLDAVVAFGRETGSGERLVIGVEDRGNLPEDLEARVRAAVRGYLDVIPEEVVRLDPRDFLRTTSGKIRRAAIREQYVARAGG